MLWFGGLSRRLWLPLLVLVGVAAWAVTRFLMSPTVEQTEQLLLHKNRAAELAHHQAERAYAEGNWAEAQRGFETAARLEPRSAQALLNLASTQERLAQRRKALETLGRVLELQPRWGLAWSRRAQLYVDEQQLAEAETAARQAVHFAPKLPDAWLAQARVLLLQGNLEQSERSARRATELAPSSAPAWLALGDVLMRSPGGRRLEEALRAFNQAASLDSGFYPHLRRGEALRQSGRASEAVTALEDAARRAPGDPAPAYQLSMALQDAGRPSEARRWAARSRDLQERRYRLTTLSRKAEQSPGDVGLQVNLAAELQRAGDREGAMRACRKALALDPGNQKARSLLAALEAGIAR